jgi:hypothetical protein
MQKPEQAPSATEGPAPTPLSAVAATVSVGMQGGLDGNPDPMGTNHLIGSGNGRTAGSPVDVPGGATPGVSAHPSNPFASGKWFPGAK